MLLLGYVASRAGNDEHPRRYRYRYRRAAPQKNEHCNIGIATWCFSQPGHIRVAFWFPCRLYFIRPAPHLFHVGAHSHTTQPSKATMADSAPAAQPPQQPPTGSGSASRKKGECLICGETATYQPDGCGCAFTYCKAHAMKLATGGRCKSCKAFFGGMRLST